MTAALKSWRVALSTALLTLGLCGCFLSPQQKAAKFLSLGKEMYARKDYPRAIIQFTNATHLAPADAEAFYQLGLAYAATGDLGSAYQSFNKATVLNPKHADAQLKLASLMLLSKKREVAEEAQRRVKEVLGSGPASPEALNILAFSELKLGKEEDAIAHLQQILRQFPADLRSSVLLTQIKLTNRDITGAEQILKNCIDKAPASTEAALALGRLYVALKKVDLAEQQFRRALQIDPKYGPALKDLGMLQFQYGTKQEAEQIFKRLSALPDKQYKPVHALFLMELGQRDAAVREFERLAAEDESDRDARTRLVAAYFYVGRSADAEKVLRRVLEKNPKDADALVQRAGLFVRTNRFSAAEDDLARALRFRPDLPQAHAALAAVYEASGASLRARQELSEALRLAPSMLSVRLNLARLLTASRAPAAALEVLDAKNTPEAQKRLVPFIVQRNWALMALGNMEELRKGIQLGLVADRTPELLVQDALAKTGEKNYPAAKTSLDEALSQDPEYRPALEALLRLYALQNKSPEAIEKIRVYVAKRPKSALLLGILGNLLAKDGKRDEARRMYLQAQAAAPDYTNVIFALARLDVTEGKFDSARHGLTKLLSLDPKNPQVWMYSGLLEADRKNYPDAIGNFRKALDLDPKNAVALNNLAYMLATNADHVDEALQFVQKAKEIAPDLPHIDDTLGWVLYNKGIYQSAVGYLETARNKYDDPAIRYHLAMTYSKLGDKRGTPLLRAALRAAPDLPEAEIAQRLLAENSRGAK